MSATIAKLSSALLTGVSRQTAHLSAVKSSGVMNNYGGGLGEGSPPTAATVSSAADGFGVVFPGHFSTSITNERIPTEAEVNIALKNWESRVDTEQLTETEKQIHKVHTQAVKNQQETYLDPVTGYHVYSLYGHITRGSCCGNSCRHCPYDHENVSSRYKSIKKNNGAFYC